MAEEQEGALQRVAPSAFVTFRTRDAQVGKGCSRHQWEANSGSTWAFAGACFAACTSTNLHVT